MLSRRSLLVTSALAAGASALPTALATEKKPRQAPASAKGLEDWNAVRQQFELDPRYVHLGLFYIASNPRPVREALEGYRRQIDANPLQAVEQRLFGKPQDHMPTKVCTAIASYIGGKAEEIALTQNTTTGLALLYQGLP